MLKFHPSTMKDKPNMPVLQTSPVTSTKPDGTVMNPAFQDIDGLTNQVAGSTYGSYHTLTNENYPTRSVSTISPVSKGDYPVGRANPAFLNDNPDSANHVYPERPLDGLYATKSLPRPEIKTPSHNSRRSYSPTEDRELPTYYMPVNSHRKLLRGEILYVTKDTRNTGTKCWKRALCIGLIAAVLVVAIVIGSLSGTGILFNRNQNGDAVQANVSSLSGSEGIVTKNGVDIEVHELDASAGQVSPSRLDLSGKDVAREPKSDETLTEFRRQHPGEALASTQKPMLGTSRQSTVVGGVKTQEALVIVDDQSSFNDGVPEAVEGELRIMNMDFQTALTDRNSWIFQYTSNDLAVYLNEIFMKATNSINYNATRIISFRQGSVIVKYQALWNQASDKWDSVVMNILNKHLDVNNNFIGNYLVDRGSVSAKSIFYTCRINNGGCSHLCEFDLLEMRHYCLCPDNTYSLINLTTCVPTTSRASISSTTQSVLPVSDTTTVRTTLGSTVLPITKESSTETSTTTTHATKVSHETTQISAKSTIFSTTSISDVVTTAPPTVHIPIDLTTHQTTASSADHVGLLIVQSDHLSHGSSNSDSTSTVTSILSTVSPTSPDHMEIFVRKNTTKQLIIFHSDFPTSTVTSAWENALNLTTTPAHWTTASSTVAPTEKTASSTVTPTETTTESGAVHLAMLPSTVNVSVDTEHRFIAVVNVSQLSSSTLATENHHTESPTSSAMPGSLDINHINSTFFGHVPIPFGKSASHDGTTTEDDLDHHEDVEHSTTNRPTHFESDFLVTNHTEIDVVEHSVPKVEHSVPQAASGELALLTLRKTTTPEPNHSLVCPSNQFFCAGDNRCLPNLAQCNGVQECSDGSDERNCSDCHQNFRCLTGNCIPVGLVCDGIQDCSDGSDELKCTQNFCQSAGMFHCVSGYCLENSTRCDGLGDCYAMSLPVDEMNCFGPQISNLCADAGHFMCSQSRRCIPMNWRCNGRTDCLNNEDEKSCTCDPATTFACDGGGCVDNAYRCNGVAECPDGYSDERDCLRLQTTGLLEVQYMNNEWRSVCSDNWNLRSANAVCRQLGYRPAMSIFSLETPIGNNSKNVFWMDPNANNQQLVQSHLRGTTSDNCLTDSTRAGVMCERFRCQSVSDPEIANPSKLLSAVVKISFDNDSFTICHGFLVAPMWVLTAASCLANRNASGMKLSFYMDAFHTQVVEVDVHPLYLPVRMLHDRDFALLKLAETVPSNFLPLCLPTDYEPLLCKLVKLNGSAAFSASKIEKVNTTDCNAKSNFAGFVSGSMECWTSSQSLCDDDTVSPTICQTVLGNWEFRGFLSYQHHCSFFSKKPFITANLSYAVSWIRSIVGPSLSNVIQTTEPSAFVPALTQGASQAGTVPLQEAPQVRVVVSQGAPQVGVVVSQGAPQAGAVHEIVVPEPPTATGHGLHGDADSLAELQTDVQWTNASESVPFSNMTMQNVTRFEVNSSIFLTGIPSFNVSSTSVNANVSNVDVTPTSLAGLTCPDGTPLLLDFLCDGIFQCSDGWDEKMENCMNISCPLPGHQRCANGRCIEFVGVCDGRSQCPVINTDEVGCKDCDKTTHFKCLEGRCIPSSWVCDGENDCMYGDDETGDRCTLCQNATDSFRCTYGGGCVSNSKVCDGFFDCPDSSDESFCVKIFPKNESVSSAGVVQIRSHGSTWLPVCQSGIDRTKSAQWAETVCHEIGFDYSNGTDSTFFNVSNFAIFNEFSTDSNFFLAQKNVTTQCNNSEVLTATCGFIQRGDWNKNVSALDQTVPYKVPQDEYRHIVLLIHVKGGLEPCVGTLLSSRWIVTSHECISEADSSLSPFDWIVSTDPDSVDDNSLRFIRRFVAHPSVKFSVYFSRHDLVLVELMEGVDLTSGTNKVAWPARHPMTVKSTCVTYGWLYSSVEIPGTRVQRKSQGQLLSWRTSLMMNEQCNQASNYNGLVDGAMFCGGLQNATHRSPCMGRVDGAPVMCLNADNMWEITGVRSYQPPCDSSWLAPSVYTDLYQHRRWIGDIVGASLTAA